MNLIVKDPLQNKIEMVNWIVLAVLFVSALILTSIKFSLGILLGGFISIVNFYWMERGLRDLFTNNSKSIKARIIVKYYIRLALIAIVLYFLIAYGTVNVIGLLIGLSVVVINIIITLITTMAKKKLIEEVIK
ncbi:MAG: ATP synthase subunit I [Smithella sp.]